jgi:hypothetical protein
MLDQRTLETCLIDCTKSLDNIYGSGSQTYRPKGKTYRDAQLKEHIHSIVVEHAPEHEVCGSEPAEEKREESAVATTWWRHGRRNGM